MKSETCCYDNAKEYRYGITNQDPHTTRRKLRATRKNQISLTCKLCGYRYCDHNIAVQHIGVKNA